MKKYCEAFNMDSPEEAFQHIRNNCSMIKEYGSYAYGHNLHTWDRGERHLIACEHCGAMILVQSSEYHMFDDDDDYDDYFPVESKQEAEMLNEKYDGWSIEKEFSGRYLRLTNGQPSWSK